MAKCGVVLSVVYFLLEVHLQYSCVCVVVVFPEDKNESCTTSRLVCVWLCVFCGEDSRMPTTTVLLSCYSQIRTSMRYIQRNPFCVQRLMFFCLGQQGLRVNNVYTGQGSKRSSTFSVGRLLLACRYICWVHVCVNKKNTILIENISPCWYHSVWIAGNITLTLPGGGGGADEMHGEVKQRI